MHLGKYFVISEILFSKIVLVSLMKANAIFFEQWVLCNRRHPTDKIKNTVNGVLQYMPKNITQSSVKEGFLFVYCPYAPEINQSKPLC